MAASCLRQAMLRDGSITQHHLCTVSAAHHAYPHWPRRTLLQCPTVKLVFA